MIATCCRGFMHFSSRSLAGLLDRPCNPDGLRWGRRAAGLSSPTLLLCGPRWSDFSPSSLVVRTTPSSPVARGLFSVDLMLLYWVNSFMAGWVAARGLLRLRGWQVMEIYRERRLRLFDVDAGLKRWLLIPAQQQSAIFRLCCKLFPYTLNSKVPGMVIAICFPVECTCFEYLLVMLLLVTAL